MAKSTLTFPIETAREFRVLFELCRLCGNRPENSVEMGLLSKTADLGSEYFDHSIESLMAAKLAEFDKQVGNLRVTRYGISEIITAKACPNSRTNYFPSINSMKIRLSRGHHLFDEVEPLWPEELSVPEKAAVATQSSKYIPNGTRARAMRKSTRRDDNKRGNASSESIRSKADIIAEMIVELELLATQLVTTPGTIPTTTTKTPRANVRQQSKAVAIKRRSPQGHPADSQTQAAQRTATKKSSQTLAGQGVQARKRQPAPLPGSYPSLLFSCNPTTRAMPAALVGADEKTSTVPEKRSGEVDTSTLVRNSPAAKHELNTANQNNKPDQGNAFDQLCNLIQTKYQQSSLSTDKRAPRRRRQLLKELEAVNETLFSYA